MEFEYYPCDEKFKWHIWAFFIHQRKKNLNSLPIIPLHFTAFKTDENSAFPKIVRTKLNFMHD